MIVADAGPLIAFARIGRLALLREVVGELIIPDAVYEEVVTRGRGRPGAAELAQSPWVHRQSLSDQGLLADLPTALHPGEQAAIILAQHVGAQLLIDEHRGRAAAEARGIEVIGSLAILAAAKRRGFIERVRPVLYELLASGYWMDADLVEAFLAEMDEGDNPVSS